MKIRFSVKNKKKLSNVVLKAFIVEQQSSENIKNELETKVEFLWNPKPKRRDEEKSYMRKVDLS